MSRQKANFPRQTEEKKRAHKRLNYFVRVLAAVYVKDYFIPFAGMEKDGTGVPGSHKERGGK